MLKKFSVYNQNFIVSFSYKDNESEDILKEAEELESDSIQLFNFTSTIKKESFSTAAIKDKMSFLSDYYKTDIGIEYEKITKGTKVIIKIPYTIL